MTRDEACAQIAVVVAILVFLLNAAAMGAALALFMLGG